MKPCPICKKPTEEDGPFSLCFDPVWRGNMWGGDSHEYVCFVCEDCGRRVAMEHGKEIPNEI